MALIRKTGRNRDFRNWKICAGKQLHGSPDPTLNQVVVRRHAFGLLERAGEMKHRHSRDAGERLKADILVEVRLDVLAHSSDCSRQKAAADAPDASRRSPAVGDATGGKRRGVRTIAQLQVRVWWRCRLCDVRLFRNCRGHDPHPFAIQTRCDKIRRSDAREMGGRRPLVELMRANFWKRGTERPHTQWSFSEG
jgi:hypothetical protein